MEDVVVELRNVTKRFDRVTAVEKVTLEIRRGEFFALLGPSGCGKTTSLRLVAGFEEPDEGEIKIDGESVANLPPYRRRVNTVFQNYALFPHLNVFENVAFGLRRRGVPEGEIRQRVQKILEKVQLPGYERRRIHEISGGQQQRVAVARALVNEPRVLLLDEPMSALDPKLRREMREELKRLQKQLGITFILVTHDQEEALSTSDRVAVLNQGRLEQVGTPREIYERPRSRFVADFIGTANFLTVRVASVDQGRAVLEVDGGQVAAPCNGKTAAGVAAELSVRPEQLWLTRDNGGGNGHNCLPARVVDITYMGPVTRYTVQLTGGQRLCAEQQNQASSDGFATGEAVYLQWKPTAGTLLPA
ncbi:MAG: ABC transporter ATP-binding protein [Candidatus Eremiobacterota bacterium]